MVITPLLGFKSPVTKLEIVVLPDPLGPSNTKKDPAGMVRENFFNICLLL